jgi:PPOX class probable F420-dependent enzyme
MTDLQTFTSSKSVLLTTYKRDGTGVATPVSLAVEGDHAYFRTWDTAWKARRLRNNPQIEIAEREGGPVLRARAELVNGAEAKHAAKLIAHKHPILQRIVVPAFHRMTGKKTLHYRVTAV